MAEVRDNIVNLEKVIQQLNKALDENIKRLNIGAVSVANFTNSFSNIPSQYLKLLSDLADKNQALNATQARLLKVEKELEKLRQRQTNSTRERNARTAEEIVNQRTLAQNADRQARATSALVGAYANLNARHQEASRRLQDLIVRGRTAEQTQRQYNRELRNAQREFQSLDARIRHADQAVGRFNRNVGNYPRQAVAGIRNLIGAFGVVGGVSLFASIATDIYQTTKELQSLDMALKQVSGTNEQFSRSQAFLSEIAQAYGLEIKSLTTQFTQFYVSAKDKLSATQIEGIFKSISKAGAVMGLSVENQKRAFLALNQMMSKGTVQAEELRGQLGEALPGAFGIMAKAMGTTEQGLAKLMKDGKVLADEVLPKFAKELEKVYGIETIENVNTLTASQNRLNNEWTLFIRELNDGSGVMSEFLIMALDGLNEVLYVMRELNKSERDLGEDYAKSIISNAPEDGKSKVDYYIKEIDKVQAFQKKIKDAEKEYNSLKKQYDDSGVVFKDAVVREKMLKAQERMNKLKKEEAKNNAALFSLEKALEETTKKRSDLEAQFVATFMERNKQVTHAVALDYAKSKTDKQLINEMRLIEKGYNANTKATEGNTKAKKEAEIYQIGTVKWLNQQISNLKELNDTLSDSSDEYQVGVGAIKFYEQWLERLTGTAKKASEELDGISIDLSDDKPMTDSEGDAIKKEGDELRAWYKDFRKSFQDNFWENSGFSKIQFIIDNWDTLKQSGIDTALAISEAFQQAFNTISEASENNFNAEYSRLEEQKDFAIEMAGGSATAREEIERQYEERKRAIQRREAESKKRLAIFNIAIDTAQAIVSSFKTDPTGIMAIAIGVIGAVQAGLVASQQIPQFWKGTENAPEGLAWTQEKGAEVITDRHGKVKTLGSDKGAQLTYLRKGDKVYKSHEDYINKVLSKNGIDNLGSYMNFAPQTEIINNGITKADLEQNFSKLANVIKNKDGVSISIDEQGFRKKQGNTEFINSRLNLKSRLV